MTLFHALHAAHFPHTAKLALTHSAERVLEGSHWGAIATVDAGRGTSRSRVTVYPPGTAAGERRAMRFLRAWPVVGAVLGMFLLLALNAWPLPLAMMTVLGMYAAGFAAALSVTKRVRDGSHHVEVVSVYAGGHTETVGDIGFYNAVTDQLRCIDTLSARGELTPVGYEARWAAVYASIPEPETPDTARRRSHS